MHLPNIVLILIISKLILFELLENTKKSICQLYQILPGIFFTIFMFLITYKETTGKIE